MVLSSIMSQGAITTPNVVIQDQPAKIVSVEMAPQLDLEEKSLEAPVYKWTKLTQVSGGASQTLTSSTTLNTFNVPGNIAMNLSRSFITFDLNIGTPTNNNWNVAFSDCVPIDYIQFTSQSGDTIAEVRNAQIYTKVVRPAHTHMDEYNSRGPVYPAATVAASGYSTNHYLQPASWLSRSAATVAAAGAGGGPFTSTQILADQEINTKYMTDVAAGTMSVSKSWVQGKVKLDSVTITDYDAVLLGVNYQDSGVDKDGAPQGLLVAAQNAALIVKCKVPLSAFSGTLLAMDKDLYFGQNMQLKVQWQPISKWGFQTNSLTATSATDAAFSSISLDNYYLWLCKDCNPKNVEQLMRQNQTTGVELLVPWSDGNNRPISLAATSYTHSTLISPGAGLAVKRCITTLIQGDNDLSSTASANNVNQVKYSSIQTSIDSRYIQDAPLVDTAEEVYNYMYPLVKQSPAGLSSRCWHIRNFFCDNFSDPDPLHKANDNDTLYSGLSIGPVYRQYDVKYDTSNNLYTMVCYQWVIYLKKLRITPISVRYV